jgi:serine/threonine protein kinase
MSNRTILIGGQKVNLTDSDYIAQGGQGVVYLKNNAIFKIYHDPKQLIPEDKMDELQVLDGITNVVIPSKSIYDPANNQRIGFGMRYIKDTEFLCKLFVANFKAQNKISPQMIVSLVKNMQETLISIHQKGIIVGDYNEMNFLVDKGFSIPYYIDTDSYQTPSYKCNAIMDSVRDRTLPMGDFTEFSDWYSWGIVTFQLYTGIHPFKGKHPKYKMNDLDGRMTDNISVFDKDVAVPKFVNFTGIPKAHLEWYKKVFIDGERSIPPFSDGVINYAVITNTFIDPNASVTATLLYTVGGMILDTSWRSGAHHILTTDGFYYGDQKKVSFALDIDRGSIIYTSTGEFVFIVEKDKIVYAFDEDKNKIKQFDMDYQSYAVFNNCLYVMQESGLVQYSFEKIGKLKMIPKPISTLNLNSSKIFDGVVMQELYGKYKAIIPYEYNGCSSIDLKEIKTNRIFDAKRIDRWMFIITEASNGTADFYRIYFNENFTKYELKCDKDVAFRNINAMVKDNGMVVLNTEDDTLELFFDFKRGTKVIEDSPVQNHLKLIDGKTTCFIDGDKIYSIQMK